MKKTVMVGMRSVGISIKVFPDSCHFASLR